MFGHDGCFIVLRMDIGKTIRCYTVEPLRDPIPRLSTESPAEPVPSPEYGYEQHALLSSDPTLASLLSPVLVRRLGG